jgi:2-keto-4-pentenoate hydratase
VDWNDLHRHGREEAIVNAWDDPRIVLGMRTQLAHRRARVAAGDKPLGWKVAFGTLAAMTKFRIDAPLVGFLMKSGLASSGGEVSLRGWIKPIAEPEIAVHMGEDLKSGADREAVKAAIEAIGPAIELVDLDPLPENVEEILSGNIFQRRVIVGPRDASRSGGNAEGLTCRVTRHDVEFARTTDPQANTGELVAIVHHVADVLGAFGERLRAGDVIITGSVVPPLFIEIDEDSIAFALDPIGGVSVRFVR